MDWRMSPKMNPETLHRFRLVIERLYRLDYKVECLERRAKGLERRAKAGERRLLRGGH